MMTQLFTPFPAHSAWRLLRALFALPAAASLTVLGGCSFRAPPPDGSGTIECTQVDLAPQVSGRLIAGPKFAKVDPESTRLPSPSAWSPATALRLMSG